MLPRNQRETSQEQLEMELRQRALKSLLSMRQKQLRETLDHRIKRAGKIGEGQNLSRAEWAKLHKQEIAHAQLQMEDLRRQSAHMQGQLRKLKRAMNRARRLRASQASAGRKRK
jgi:hypothetical protein